MVWRRIKDYLGLAAVVTTLAGCGGSVSRQDLSDRLGGDGGIISISAGDGNSAAYSKGGDFIADAGISNATNQLHGEMKIGMKSGIVYLSNTTIINTTFAMMFDNLKF